MNYSYVRKKYTDTCRRESLEPQERTNTTKQRSSTHEGVTYLFARSSVLTAFVNMLSNSVCTRWLRANSCDASKWSATYHTVCL